MLTRQSLVEGVVYPAASSLTIVAVMVSVLPRATVFIPAVVVVPVVLVAAVMVIRALRRLRGSRRLWLWCLSWLRSLRDKSNAEHRTKTQGTSQAINCR